MSDFGSLTEHVRITLYHRAEVCVDSVFPLVFQLGTIDASKSHIGHAAGDCIESSGERDNVELVLLFFRAKSFFGELDDFVLTGMANIYQIHMW